MTKPIDIVRDYCARFPDAPSQTLGKRIQSDNPGLYPSVEHCQWAVRRVFGVAGERSRMSKNKDILKLKREKRAADWTQKIPPAKTYQDDWATFDLTGPMRVLVLSDPHAPFHNRKALTEAISYGVQEKATHVILNGDVCDFYAASRFETDPRKRDLLGEVEAVKGLLDAIRTALPKATIIWKNGNHEERWFRYLCTAAPALLDLRELSLPVLFDMEKFKVEHIADRRAIRFQDWHLLHGHEFGPSFGNSVSPARTYWTKSLGNIIVGHVHRTSTHSEKDISGNWTFAHSSGSLCDLHPEYMPFAKWNNGFVFFEVKKSGAVRLENLRNDQL